MISTVHATITSLALFADTIRTTFSWDRIHSNRDWILPVVILFAVAIFVRKWYERDAQELGRRIGWLLTILRTLAFVGLFILYLQPQWRTETERRIESRAAVLVDTSLSMALTDPGEGDNATIENETNRADQVAKLLSGTDLLERLRKTHNVDVYTFGNKLQPVTTLKKISPPGETDTNSDTSDQSTETDDKADEKPLDWNVALKPKDPETRLGDALTQLLDEVRDAPVSGVIVLTDGRQNTGIDPASATAMAAQEKVKLLPVGIGSDVLPANVRVSRFAVPATSPARRSLLGDRIPPIAKTGRKDRQSRAAPQGQHF